MSENRDGHMTDNSSAPTLNTQAESHAMSLVGQGKISEAAWNFTADQENKLLGADGSNWANYAAWHLGIDKNADPKTKAAYKYPFGDGSQVFTRALAAIRSRSSPDGPQPAPAIFDAAGKLLDAAKKKTGKDDDSKTRRLPTGREIRSMTDMPLIDGNSLCGYAAVYGSMSEDLGGFCEIVKPGAFDRCLRGNPDVRCLIDHDSSMILGRTKSGTAKLWADDRGLRYQVDNLPDTQAARDLKISMQRGDIDGSSFAFQIADNGDTWSRQGNQVIREVRDCDLFDVSVVTYPAYAASEASLRGMNLLARTEQEAAQIAAKAAMESRRRRQRQVDVELSLR